MKLVLPSKLCSCLRHCSGIFHCTKSSWKQYACHAHPDYTLLGSQFSTRKKVHFQFTFKWNFNIRIRVSFQNENHNERILECSLLAKASFPRYSSPGGGGGWRYSKTFYKGRLRPKVQPLTLLYTIFDRKSTPFLHSWTSQNGHLKDRRKWPL